MAIIIGPLNILFDTEITLLLLECEPVRLLIFGKKIQGLQPYWEVRLSKF